jgi:hypothetical protein
MAWIMRTDILKGNCNDDKAVLARRDILAGLGAVGVLAVAGSTLLTATSAPAEPAGAGSASDAMASSAKADELVEAKAGGAEMPATDISAQRYYRVRRRYWRRRRRWHRRYWRRRRYWW